MREIIFRGKSKVTGEWIEGNLINNDKCESGGIYIYDCTNNFSISCMECEKIIEFIDKLEIIPKTIGQYTGLKDKNGKMIFEGDLLKYLILSPSVVEYYAGSFGYWLDKGEKYQSFMSYSHPNFKFNSFKQQSDQHEVVGNIHDNPELLTNRL